jgi:hypothetical protein
MLAFTYTKITKIKVAKWGTPKKDLKKKICLKWRLNLQQNCHQQIVEVDERDNVVKLIIDVH